MSKMANLTGQPVTKSQLLAIGDGILTDIKGASLNGFDAYFVTGGIHAEELGDMKVVGNVSDAFFKIRHQYPNINLVAVSDQLRWI